MTARLSRAEWLVWACLRAGMTYPQAAYSLGVKRASIHTYMRRGVAKLGRRAYGPNGPDAVDHA